MNSFDWVQLNLSFDTRNVKMSQETIRWPQYAAGLSAAGGALAIGSALG
jgi:hypothetical protein